MSDLSDLNTNVAKAAYYLQRAQDLDDGKVNGGEYTLDLDGTDLVVTEEN